MRNVYSGNIFEEVNDKERIMCIDTKKLRTISESGG